MTIKAKLSRWWFGLLSSICFLTRIPLPLNPSRAFDGRSSVTMFPLCGLGIGVIAATLDASASTLWDRPAVSFLMVGFLAWISGALHLDGLTDTADGLYGHREPERTLSIMKDSRIGAMGAVTLVFCVIFKWVGIWGIDSQRFLYIALVPAYARSTALFGIRLLPYGRPDGTGHGFFQDPMKWTDFWGVACLLGLSLLLGRRMVVLNLAFAFVVATCLIYYHRKLKCITGDMLGALIEITETALFFILSAGKGT